MTDTTMNNEKVHLLDGDGDSDSLRYSSHNVAGAARAATSTGSNFNGFPHDDSVTSTSTLTAHCDGCRNILKFSVNASLVCCPDCSYYTVVKEPPPGKRYFRCGECHTVSKCNITVHAVKCPRCQYVTNISGTPPGKKYGNCWACNNVLLYSQHARAIRCTQCLARMVVNRRSFTNRLLLFVLIGFLLIGIGVGITIGTLNETSAALYVVAYGPITAGVLLWIRVIAMKLMYAHYIIDSSPKA